jgi:hypothetical protein
MGVAVGLAIGCLCSEVVDAADGMLCGGGDFCALALHVAGADATRAL